MDVDEDGRIMEAGLLKPSTTCPNQKRLRYSFQSLFSISFFTPRKLEKEKTSTRVNVVATFTKRERAQ